MGAPALLVRAMLGRTFGELRFITAVLLLLLATPLQATAQIAKPVEQTGNSQNPICPMIEAAAQANGLPVEFFTRLIWQESRLQPEEVGPLTHGGRALGIAQFMPGTAIERQLYEPFNPVEALPKSGEFLAELRAEFGNLGLAAAAYNAGPQRVRDFLAGLRDLPSETRRYVLAITGHPVEQWAASVPQQSNPASTVALHIEGDQVNCRDIVAWLGRHSDPMLAQWRNVPSWCRGLRHPDTAVCGPVHLIEQLPRIASAVRVRSHVHLVRATSR